MKTLYKILILFILGVVSNSAYSQITVLEAVAVDGDSDGFYGTVEFKFSKPVNDTEFSLSAIDQDEWEFSLNSDFTTEPVLLANTFYTDVLVIATESDANDQFVRVTFNTAFSSCDGPIYFRYTNGNPGVDSISAFYTPDDILADITPTAASDNSAPVIIEPITYNPSLNVVGVGEKINFSFSVEGSETGVLAESILFNNTNIPADSLKDNGDGSYYFNYWVPEGENDVSDSDTIPFYLELKDSYGNIAETFTESPTSANCPGIDANTPAISTVYFEPGDGNIVGDNKDIFVYLTVDGGESGLTDDYILVNNVIPDNFEEISGGYKITYFTDKNNDDEINDNIRIPLKIVLTDGVNVTDTLRETDLLTDNSPGISFSSPVISSVSFLPVTGTTIGVGDTLTATIYADATGLDASLLKINDSTLYNESLVDNNDNSYTVKYIVSEGDPSKRDDEKIHFNFILNDGVGDSNEYNENNPAIDVDDFPAIDAVTPVINSIVFSTGNSNTIGVGFILNIDIDLDIDESGLIATKFKVNGVNVTDFNYESPGYSAKYTVQEGHNDIDDATKIPVSIILSDGTNLSTEFTEADFSDITPGVDANTPKVSSVVFTPGNGNTVGDGNSVILDIYEANSETLLSINTLEVNNENIIGTFTEDVSINGLYHATYTVSETDTEIDDVLAKLPLSIILSDGTNLSNEFTEDSIASDNSPGIDGDAPTISSITFTPGDGNTLGIDSTVIIDITAGGSEENLTLNAFTVNGVDISSTFVEDGSGDYHGIYSVGSIHTNRDDAVVPLPFSVTLSDGANTVIKTQADYGDISPGVDKDTPGITSVNVIENGTGVSIVGNTITFEINLTTPEAGLAVSPTEYNGKAISWDTSSDPAKYTAVYIVEENDIDQAVAVDLIDVTLIDDAGNTSNSENGVVNLGIDAHTPTISDIDASTAGGSILKIGDEVDFEITVSPAEHGLTVNKTDFNGGTLVWSTLDGSTYKSTYTVAAGHTELSNIQLTAVTVKDAAGNTSGLANSNILTNVIDSDYPFISSVYLKNDSKIINEEDTLHITITADAGYNTYTLESGTVAGYPIKSITKVNSTTIQALFDIDERTYDIDSLEAIMVNNLQLADEAGNVSNIIDNIDVSNANHAIFSKDPTAYISGSDEVCDNESFEIPVFLNGHAPFSITYTADGGPPQIINSISSSPYKLNIVADGSIDVVVTYAITDVTDATGNSNAGDGTFDLTINDLPTASFDSPISGVNFDISEDTVDLEGNYDPDGVFSGTGVLNSSRQFSPKIAGLGSHDLTYEYEDGNGCYDSETITVEVIEGGNITFIQGKTVYCSYTDTFSVVGFNNFTEDGTFSLDGDPGGALINIAIDTAIVKPELLTAGSSYNIRYIYPSGTDIVRSFSVEKVGSTITFDPIADKCEDYETIVVEAKNLDPLGGDGFYTLKGGASDVNYTSNTISLNPGELIPDGGNPRTYNLEYHYVTSNGCTSDTIKDEFILNPLPVVNITMETLYDINGGTHIINGTPDSPPGVFSPSFMIDNDDGTAEFDPEIAGLGDFTAYYAYTDLKGCSNVDSAEFTINEAEADIFGLDIYNSNKQYCYYNSNLDTVWAVATNGDGAPGIFTIDGNVVTDIVGNDSISINPSDLESGDHTLRFSYQNGSVNFYIEEIFNIDSIGTTFFTGLDPEYCEDNDQEIVLTCNRDDGTNIFDTHLGLIDNNDNDVFAEYNPSNASTGASSVSFTFTRTYSNCYKIYNQNVTINKTPDFDFDLDKLCVVDVFDSVQFIADTLGTDNVVSWDWKIITPVTEKTQNVENPKFSLVPQNNNYAELTLTTDKGCTDIVSKTSFIGSVVDLDFTWDKECHGETVTFTTIDFTDPLGVDSVKWNFGGAGTEDITDEYQPLFAYASPGGYDVEYQEYTSTCGLVSKSKRIFIRPSITIESIGYSEEFEQASEITGWAVDLNSTSNSWEWGIPNGTIIKSAAGGSNAFVTNLDGNYNNNERSYVSSPCFDFSNLEKPIVKFDFISDLELSRDGAILEYSIEKDKWLAVGLFGQGINWYNSFNLNSGIIGQSSGWNGNGITLSDSDTSSWNNAKYWLDGIAGVAGVRFRFVMGSDEFNSNEGFGFDNFWIGERNRLVLLEHFANPNDYEEFVFAQGIIENIVELNPQDVIPIQFFTSFPSSNDISDFYTAGPSARSLYYGVSGVPFSLVDGGERKFNYGEANYLKSDDINRRMLEESIFDIKVDQELNGNNLSIKAAIVVTEAMEQTKLSVRAAIVEKNVESYMNIVRTMLPDPAGVLINESWEVDDSVRLYHSWEIPDGVIADSLITIVFVQNEKTKEVYQAGFANTFSTITSVEESIENILDIEYAVYPNPMNDILTVKIYKSLNHELDIYMYNSVGALVKTEKMNAGSVQQVINTNDLPAGMYYLKLGNTDKLIDTKKIIKTN